MSSIEQLKSEAAALEAKAHAQGHPMKHCDALEQIARNHGYDSWRACRAILGDPVSAISTPLPEKRSINAIEMKRYNSKEWNFALDIPRALEHISRRANQQSERGDPFRFARKRGASLNHF